MKKMALRFLFPILLLVLSCKDTTQNGNPVPYVSVSVNINTNNPLYNDLNREGGFVMVDNVGYKGIIVIHDFSDNFWAFDRTCTYHTNSSCGKVIMSSTGLNMVCGTYNGKNLDACCASAYNLDGTVSHGPATYALRRYGVNVTGDNVGGYILTITN